MKLKIIGCFTVAALIAAVLIAGCVNITNPSPTSSPSASTTYTSTTSARFPITENESQNAKDTTWSTFVVALEGFTQEEHLTNVTHGPTRVNAYGHDTYTVSGKNETGGQESYTIEQTNDYNDLQTRFNQVVDGYKQDGFTTIKSNSTDWIGFKIVNNQFVSAGESKSLFGEENVLFSIEKGYLLAQSH